MVTIKFMCPLCKKIFKGEVPKVSLGEIGSAGFVHNNHVVIVDYDYHGVIRSINAINVCNVIDGDFISCPYCNEPIRIPNDIEGYTELAYVHKDHVAIVYLFDRKHYAIDVVNIVSEQETATQKENPIDSIINKVGLNLASNLLIRRIIFGKSDIDAPKEVLRLINKIVKELDISKNVDLGIDISIAERISYTFFEKFLEKIRKLSKDIALYKLGNLVKLIRKYILLLDHFHREGMNELAEEFINQITNEDLRTFVHQIYSQLSSGEKMQKETQLNFTVNMN
ncbi:MAG: hypothetical protein ACP6IQ_11020 [Candidatus Njordarchaeia archaeon]